MIQIECVVGTMTVKVNSIKGGMSQLVLKESLKPDVFKAYDEEGENFYCSDDEIRMYDGEDFWASIETEESYPKTNFETYLRHMKRAVERLKKLKAEYKEQVVVYTI